MANPKISVIIPVFNVDKYLEECLNSVINQTMQDIEIICINDGSTDNSLLILEKFALKDKRIKLINKQNGGYGAACNTALKEVKGEYTAIVEPDDFIDFKMFENLYALAKENDADIVKSAFFENYDTKSAKKIKKVSWSKNRNLPKNVFKITDYPIFLYFHPSIWSCIYKSDFIRKNNITFIEAKGAGWTDNPFQVMTLCLADKIIYTDNAYYYWRKINEDESDDLKDFTIPFKRIDEIHSWLEKNKINNNGIISNLIKREMSYINIVFKMVSFCDSKECIHLVKELIKKWDSTLLKNKKIFTFKERKNYFLLKHLPTLYMLEIKLFKLRKNIISLRWNKNEKVIKLGSFCYVKEVRNV